MPSARHALDGWLPIGLTFGQRELYVRWIEFGARRQSAPFVQQSIRELRSLRPPAREQVTDVAALVDYARELPSAMPAGVIFHVSRCGSTFMSNILGSGDGVVSLSEARIVSMLLGERPGAPPRPAERELGRRRSLVSAVLNVYAHHATDHAKPTVVIKCNSTNLLHLSLIRALWPSVPFLIMTRDPVEVLVSNLERPGGWVRGRHLALDRVSPFGWTGLEMQRMSEEEYCARVIGFLCSAAVPHVGSLCRVIDYERLNLPHVYEVAKFFGIALPSAHVAVVQRAATRYAKDPTGNRAFEHDSARKQQAASPAVRSAVDRWAAESYRTLVQHQCWDVQADSVPVVVH
jgi:hypothetical protein